MIKFNITGSCSPDRHYMVNLDSRLAEIKKMIDNGDYFTINRGRQYGKTTTLLALENYLKDDYIVISMSFQKQMSNEKFKNEYKFSEAFGEAFIESLEFSKWKKVYEENKNAFSNVTDLVGLFKRISRICRKSEKPIVLIIDEVDSASNNQVFLDFLAQLRSYYLDRYKSPTFQSVILAGVHDIRHIKQKIRPDAEHKLNSPWNIASEFKVDMSFSVDDISGMLADYEKDHSTGMDIQKISQLIYDYTSGYPVLVSEICKINDEDIPEKIKWTNEGIDSAVKILSQKNTPLFESLINKLEDNETLKTLVYKTLFSGKNVAFNALNNAMQSAIMYGFIKNNSGFAVISNRIFEIVLYNWFLSLEITDNEMYAVSVGDRNQFIKNNRLDMELVLKKFIQYFTDIYGNQPEKFLEDEGRKLFLMCLKPIINGVGNYYIEAETRNNRRTDVIVDYLGEQYIIEMKIWHGEEYNIRGEKQLADYLDYYHINKGYLLSFNFNKNKETGMKTINIGDKTIIEAVV